MQVTNYPIYKEQWELSKEDVLMYLSLFGQHSFQLTVDENRRFKTVFQFPDGLTFTLHWLADPSIRYVKYDTIQDVLKDYERKNISYQGFEITSFTNRDFMDQPIPDTIKRKFDFMLKVSKTASKSKKVTQGLSTEPARRKEDNMNNSYYREEYDVPSPTSIPDVFFDDMIQKINNELKFKEYLSEREAKGS